MKTVLGAIVIIVFHIVLELFLKSFFLAFPPWREVWADILWLLGRQDGGMAGWMNPSLPSSSLPPLILPLILPS